MRVIRCGDDDGIDVLLVYQTTEIPIGLGGREFLRDGREALIVDIAKRNDVGDVLELADAVTALAVNTDDSDVKFFLGGNGLGAEELRGGHPEAGGGCGRASEELASIHNEVRC